MKSKLMQLNRLLGLALLPLVNQRGMAGSDDGNEDVEIKVMVGEEEQTFKAADITNLLAQQAGATQKSQEAEEVLKAATRYGVSVEQFLSNAEGTFGIMSKLIDEKIINEQGELIKVKVPEGNPDDLNLFLQKPGPDPNNPAPTGLKQIEVAMKALVDPIAVKLGKIEEENVKLHTDNTNLMRLRLGDRIQRDFPDFTTEDVTRVFSMGERDNSKNLLEHAKDLQKTRVDKVAEQEAVFAKKYGVDIAAAQEREAFEQDPSGGAATLVKDKKLSFKKDKDSVTPADASKAFFGKFEGFKP